MTQKGDAKFKEKLTCGLKNDIWNLVIGIWLIFMRAAESLKLYTSMGSFCPKHIKFHMKKYKRVMSHDTEE